MGNIQHRQHSQDMIAISVRVGSIAKTVVVQPWGSLGASLSISLSGGLSISRSLAIISVGVTIVAIGVRVISSIGVPIAQTMITISVRVGSIAKTVVVQPWVSLGVSLSISLSGGLSRSLLYRLNSLLLSGSRSWSSSYESVGENSVSTGDRGTLVVLAANRGSVDHGMVVGIRESVVHQRCVVANSVNKPRIGLSLSP